MRHNRRFDVVAQDASKLLGANILVAKAGEIIQEATLATCFGLGVYDLVETFHPHLTKAAELRPAVITFTKDVKQLSCCAT
ncbi:hypothetical protein [Chelativorans alearense]|uniref:hypothetical protein n=1 Tax=Chelativorans alearense TaxID=2681495 RepID=UPI0013D5F33E|nr:hypothetical protein [Chelativorans alearense]